MNIGSQPITILHMRYKMPRTKQKENVYLRQDFQREVCARRGYMGLTTNEALGNATGMTLSTTRNRMITPESLTAEELRGLISVLRLDIEPVLRFLGYSTKDINTFCKSNREEKTA